MSATRLARITQQLFGSTAGTNQIAQFGSLAAGSPQRFSGTSVNPATVQSLGNFLQGWFGASVGSNSPAEEDMNALFYLCFYQIYYMLQLGIPEWDSGTTYFNGSIVQNGSGIIYMSLIDDNTNNALTVTADWVQIVAPNVIATETFIPGVSGPYTMTSADNGKTFFWSGVGQFNLIAPFPGFTFTVVMQVSASTGFQLGVGSQNSLLMHRHGSELMQGKSSDLTLRAPYGRWTFLVGSDSNWYIV